MHVPAPPVFAVSGLTKSHRLGRVRVAALRGVDLALARGEVVVVAGPSGSGKSTLLNLMGALDRPDAGTVAVDGVDVATLPERERTLLRRRRLGFVFQSFNLIPVLSARENVEYPLLIDGTPRHRCTERALEMLAAVGLAERSRHRPNQLSGGEQQRVAIARALVHRPQAVLADEPTGFLDSATAGSVMEILERLNRDLGVTVVLATHDPVLIARAPRRVLLHDGLITADGPPEAPP